MAEPSDQKPAELPPAAPTPEAPAAAPPPPPAPRPPCGRRLKMLLVRLYSLVVLAVVVWSGYMAVAYLFRSVFRPLPVPQRFVDWQGHLDAASLHQSQVAGIGGPAQRAPLGHYHKVDRWFMPDANNGCASQGCHSPLPHTRRPEVAAFANLHSTFMACGMCHQPAEGGKVSARWVALDSGKTQEPPAILRLLGYLRSEPAAIKANPAAAHEQIVSLLRNSLQVSGPEPLLNDLLLQIETSAPGSPPWVHAVDHLGAELPNHCRGEYGAKLWPASTDPTAARQQLAAAAKRYGVTADVSQRQEIRKTIHQPLVRAPESCLSCHSSPGALDLPALGYWPARVAALQELPLAKMMQQIRQGQEFQLPKVLEVPNAPKP